MMRRGKMMMAVLVAAAACQTTTESETVQALNACGAQMPPMPVWDGSPAQLPGVGQLYITSLPQNGFVLAAIVDNNIGQVVYARQVPVNKHAAFMAPIFSCLTCRIVTGGNPPPPPDVIGPTELAIFLVASGQRYADVPHQAVGDVAACTQLPPGKQF